MNGLAKKLAALYRPLINNAATFAPDGPGL